MSDRERAIFFSLIVLSWCRFMPLNPILAKTLVTNLSSSLLRGNSARFLDFSAISYSLMKRHSCFINLYASSTLSFLEGSMKSGCVIQILILACSKVHRRKWPVAISALMWRSHGFRCSMPCS